MSKQRLMRRTAAIALLVGSLWFVPLCQGQSDTATISGRVTDSTGAIIPQAQVELQSAERGTTMTTMTSEVGIYVFPSVRPGVYHISVRKQGFKATDFVGLTANVQAHIEQNFTLEVGATSESVTVTGEAEHVNTSDATVTTVVDRQFVENIPLNGRSFQTLILLTPGVVATKASFGEQGQFSINGQRANANYYTVDGVSANFGINAGGGTGQAGAGELPALNTSGGFSNLVSVDALQEFRIQTSTYAPEFGRTPGGQISLATRSGTNSFHGMVFEYLRNDVLDANDWFANQGPLPKPKERQNDFGGVFGGPIFKNRTFSFISYEGLRLRQPLVATTTVPSATLRQNAPAAMQTLLNAFPVPNRADLGNGLALFLASYSDPTSFNAASLRLDHQINNNATLFARYNYSPSENITHLGNTQVNNPRPTVFSTGTLTAGANWLISAAMSNEFRANWSRQSGRTSLSIDNFGGAVPLTSSILPSVMPQDSFFSLFILNPATTSLSLGRNGEGTQGQLNFVDNFSMVRGRHQGKFGVDYRYLFPSAFSRQADLQYLFSSTADVLASRVSTVFTASRKSPVDYAYNNFAAYAQDTWKVSPRLTTTYGVRWELNPPPHGRNSTTLLAANQTDDPTTLAFAPAGTPLWATTHNNFAPRIGLAYRLTESGSTVARGGFGVFYDLPAGTISNVVILSPNVVSAAIANVPYPPNPSSIVLPPLNTTGPFSNVMVADRHTKLPYTMQWNAALERGFSASDRVTLSYLGAAGRRLIRQERYFNLSPNFPLVQIDRNGAESDYHALQAQYQRRLSHGLQALASYTWSHSIDNGSNDSTTVPSATKINFDQERGPSEFDVRHTFASALTYDIPTVGPTAAKRIFGHWSVDSIFIARTATPVDVTISRNLGFGIFSFRPDVVADVPLYLSDSSVGGGQRFNNTVVGPRQRGPFLVSTDLRQGSLGRNALRGFGSNQLNFALRRQVNFTERFNMQVRAEFFNLFNHPNFADPIGTLGAASSGGVAFAGTFGTSPSMLNRSLGTGGQIGGFAPLYGIGGPRSIQLSLKFAF